MNQQALLAYLSEFGRSPKFYFFVKNFILNRNILILFSINIALLPVQINFLIILAHGTHLIE